MSWKIERSEGPKSSAALIRFISEANEHYKNHQQGTWAVLGGIGIMDITAYFQFQPTTQELTVWTIMALFVLASYSAWKTASDKLLKTTDRNRLVLSHGHTRQREHRANGVIGPRGTVHRIKMDSDKNTPIQEVYATIQSLTKDGVEQLGGLNVRLPIWDHHDKTKGATIRHGVSQFVEFLCEYDNGTVIVLTEEPLGYAYEGRDRIEVGPTYVLHMVIAGSDAHTEAVSVSFVRENISTLKFIQPPA